MATGLLVFCTTIGLMASIWILSRLRLVLVICVAAVVVGLLIVESIMGVVRFLSATPPGRLAARLVSSSSARWEIRGSGGQGRS